MQFGLATKAGNLHVPWQLAACGHHAMIPLAPSRGLVRGRAVLRILPRGSGRITSANCGVSGPNKSLKRRSLVRLKGSADREPVLSPRMLVAVPPCLIDCFTHPQQCAQCSGKSTSFQECSDSPASTYLAQHFGIDAPGVSVFDLRPGRRWRPVTTMQSGGFAHCP